MCIHLLNTEKTKVDFESNFKLRVTAVVYYSAWAIAGSFCTKRQYVTTMLECYLCECVCHAMQETSHTNKKHVYTRNCQNNPLVNRLDTTIIPKIEFSLFRVKHIIFWGMQLNSSFCSTGSYVYQMVVDLWTRSNYLVFE